MKRLIQKPPITFQQPPRAPDYIQREFRGVNRIDKLTIPDEFASDMSNVSASSYPALQTRPGFSLVGSALAARILGLGVWKDSQLHAVASGTWYYFNGTNWTATAGTGLSTSANYSFANFKGGFSDIRLIGANGVDPVKTWDGTTIANLANAPANANYIATYADRLFCVTNGNQLNFSEFRVATNWTTVNGDEADPGFITIETPVGEKINTVISGPRRLVIFTPNSIYNLFGSSAQDFELQSVTNDIGALSNQAVATIGGRIYFVHQTGIYAYGGSVRPDKEFSLPVQEYVNRINPSASDKVCCGTDGKNLYVGIPLDSATEPNTILTYNTEFDIWSVWQNYAPLNMAIMGQDVYIGGVEGSVRKVGGSSSDNGVPITGYWTTKVYGAASYAQRTVWKRGWIIASVPTGSSLSVYISKNPDGINDFVLVQNVPVNNGVGNARVIIPTTVTAMANFVTLKFVFTGPVTIREWSREEDNLPIY